VLHADGRGCKGGHSGDGIEFIDNDHLLVTSSNASQAIVITLDPAELLNIARSRLTRSFTIEECDTYGVDPCDSP
jgi:hypothetical protein